MLEALSKENAVQKPVIFRGFQLPATELRSSRVTLPQKTTIAPDSGAAGIAAESAMGGRKDTKMKNISFFFFSRFFFTSEQVKILTEKFKILSA